MRMFMTGVLLSASLMSLPAQTQEQIVFADSPYPPYVLGNDDDIEPKGGTAVDLVNQLFAHLPDYTVKFTMMPWKRVLRDLQYGDVDAVTMVAMTPERAEFLDFSAPLVEYQLALFYVKSAYPEGLTWQQLSDLSQFRIGVVEGYLSESKLGEMVRDGAPLNLVKLSGTEEQLFGMLEKGRVDVLCFKRESGYTLLRQKKWTSKIAASEQAIYAGAYHLGFSKARQHGKLINAINSLIDEWKASGKLDAVLHPHSPN